MKIKRPKKIIVVGVNWLGDILFMTPALRAISHSFPEAKITCLIPPRGTDLLKGNPHCDRILPVEEARGLRGVLQFIPLVRRLRKEKFDTVFFFHRSLSRACAALCAGIPTRIGVRTAKMAWLLTHSVPPPPGSVHRVHSFLHLLQAVGIPPHGVHYEFRLSPEDMRVADDLLKEWNVGPADRLVALHAGANWKLKRWPIQNFAALADALVEKYGVKIVFIGGTGDIPLVKKLTGFMKNTPFIAAGTLTLRQSGALLTKVSLFISNDSGPLHLGHAVGAAVIGLFGPTDPHLTGPLNGAKTVTLFGSIGCPVPCYQLHCPVNLCMEQVTVEQVLEAARPFIT